MQGAPGSAPLPFPTAGSRMDPEPRNTSDPFQDQRLHVAPWAAEQDKPIPGHRGGASIPPLPPLPPTLGPAVGDPGTHGMLKVVTPASGGLMKPGSSHIPTLPCPFSTPRPSKTHSSSRAGCSTGVQWDQGVLEHSQLPRPVPGCLWKGSVDALGGNCSWISASYPKPKRLPCAQAPVQPMPSLFLLGSKALEPPPRWGQARGQPLSWVLGCSWGAPSITPLCPSAHGDLAVPSHWTRQRSGSWPRCCPQTGWCHPA